MPSIKARNNPFPSVLLVEGDPEDLEANPAAGQRRLSVDTAGDLFLTDDAGVATAVGGGGSGNVATDAIWTTAGKVAVATGTATATEQWPPGREFDYVQITSPVAITASSEATANTVVTGSAVAYDGSTAVIIEFYAPDAYADNVATVDLYFYLYDGSSSIGWIGTMRSETTNRSFQTVYLMRRLTPSAATHTYSIRAANSAGAGDGSVNAGAGGSGNQVPAFIRITKA